MNSTIFRRDVARAIEVLFCCKPETFGGLPNTKEIRTAFRRRAFDTHPDRATGVGRSERDQKEAFIEVQRAYTTLMELAKRRPAVSPSRTPRPYSTRKHAEPAHAPRTLRFGEYLLKARLVSWKTLAQAVAWQQAQRPRLGELAIESGFLTREQVKEVLETRRRKGELHVLFADYAVTMGLLTQFQQMILVGRQRRMQRPIGQYFVENNLLSKDELNKALRAHRNQEPCTQPWDATYAGTESAARA